MQYNYLITIAFPTYNRKNIILQNINSLLINLKKQQLLNIEVLVMDNNSRDNTYNELKKYNIYKNFSLYKNETNIGFAKNFLNLFKKAKSNYVLIMSDEDTVEMENIKKLIHFIQKYQPHFLVTTFYDKGRRYRYFYSTKLNIFNAFNSANYISGLCYNRNIVLDIIRDSNIEIYIDNNRYLQLYPQNIISNILLLKYNSSFFYDIVVAVNKYNNEFGGIKNNYDNLEDRLLQTIDYISFVKKLCSNKILNAEESNYFIYKQVHYFILYFLNNNKINYCNENILLKKLQNKTIQLIFSFFPIIYRIKFFSRLVHAFKVK